MVEDGIGIRGIDALFSLLCRYEYTFYEVFLVEDKLCWSGWVSVVSFTENWSRFGIVVFRGCGEMG